MGLLRGMPPHGHAGHAQQTPATKVTHARAVGIVGRVVGSVRRRRAARPAPVRRVKARAAPKARSSAKRGSGRAVLRKGSAAAKAWGRKMARLRRR